MSGDTNQNNYSDDRYNDPEDCEDDDEVAYYYCMACGHTQDEGGECEVCGSQTLDEVFF